MGAAGVHSGITREALCVYVHVYVFICVYIYMRVWKRQGRRSAFRHHMADTVCMCACVRVYMCVYLHACMDVSGLTRQALYEYTCGCVCLYTFNVRI